MNDGISQCPRQTQLCYHSSRNSNPDFNVPLLLSASSCNNIWNSFSNKLWHCEL